MGPVTASSLGVQACLYTDGNDPIEVKLGCGRDRFDGAMSLSW